MEKMQRSESEEKKKKKKNLILLLQVPEFSGGTMVRPVDECHFNYNVIVLISIQVLAQYQYHWHSGCPAGGTCEHTYSK
jgi:hypothetical protein